MKLINADLSPYAARVRLQARYKGLALELAPPPEGGIKSAEYLALNPMGKIPVLILDDQRTVPESDTILEFIEDTYPTPALRPADAYGRSQARLLARIGDLYVQSTIFPLFGQMNPANRDEKLVATQFEGLEKGLAWLDCFIKPGPFALGEKVSTADCSLIPVFFFVDLMSKVFGKPDLITKHAKVQAYWSAVKAEAHAAAVLGEMAVGLENFRKRQAA